MVNTHEIIVLITSFILPFSNLFGANVLYNSYSSLQIVLKTLIKIIIVEDLYIYVFMYEYKVQ